MIVSEYEKNWKLSMKMNKQKQIVLLTIGIICVRVSLLVVTNLYVEIL
jgi:hypothetical protein